VEFGETVEDACAREIKEECLANFTFKKVLYIRDYLKPDENEHSLELFILGDIDKFNELDNFPDPEFPENHFQKWVSLNELEQINIKPKNLTPQLFKDYKNNFSDGAIYLKTIE